MDGWTALTMAAREGHADTLTALLRAGTKVNAPEGGNTALFWAAIHDHKEAVSVLAGERSGLRPNMPTNRPEIQHSRLEAQRICTSTRGRENDGAGVYGTFSGDKPPNW